jgi:hypothetical protein
VVAPARPIKPAAPRVGLDLFALVASGPFALGGGLAGRFLAFPSLRVGASLSNGSVGDATLRTVGVTIGVAPQFHDSLGARVELGFTQHSATLRGEEHSRVVGNLRVLGEGTWWTVRSFGVGVAAGVDIAFGETRLLMGETVFGTIPRARFVFELSLRGRT